MWGLFGSKPPLGSQGDQGPERSSSETETTVLWVAAPFMGTLQGGPLLVGLHRVRWKTLVALAGLGLASLLELP